MFGFLIKKNFCDGWENLLNLVIVNVICLFLGCTFAFLIFGSVNFFSLATFAIILLMTTVFGIVGLAYGPVAADIANFKGVHLTDFFKNLRGALKDGALFGLLCGGIGIVSIVGMRFYVIQLQSLFGILLAAVLFWIDIVFILSFQWFIPLHTLQNNDFKKCIKKCFLIFFDNTGFSIAMALYTLVMLLLSVFCVGFVPSYAGIILARTNALRLRLYKYDYLEAHPELETPRQRKSIPWEELIYEDRETLGPHKLKTIFFPWKN